MKIQLVKRKPGSKTDLACEVIPLPNVHTLRQLLIAITTYEYERQHQPESIQALNENEIRQQAMMGKVSFERFNKNKEGLNQAVKTMLQDFTDGLFRIFIREEACMGLDENLLLDDMDEVICLRLVMLAGRLW